jgi:hypothetical protein
MSSSSGIGDLQAACGCIAGADTETIVVYKNSVATAMTCSVTTNNNSSSCADTTNTFAVAGGDAISLQYSQTNGAPFNKVSVKPVNRAVSLSRSSLHHEATKETERHEVL